MKLKYTNARDHAPVQAWSADSAPFPLDRRNSTGAQGKGLAGDLAGRVQAGNRSLVRAVGSLALPSVAPLVLFIAALAWSEDPTRPYQVLGVLAFFMLFPGRWSLTPDAVDVNRQVLSPWDIEQTIGISQGNIFHGELTLSQLFFLRPAPGAAQYRTPLRHYYQCGSGTHPGGGITGAPGRLAAVQMLREWKSN